MMQFANGIELKGLLLFLAMPCGTCVNNGLPHNPSTQSFVEQANGTMKTLIHAWMHDNYSTKWASALPKITMAMNRSVYGSAGKRPHQDKFGRKPRWEDCSVLQSLELTIKNADITVKTEENCDTQADMTRIAKDMEYYWFKFDSTEDNIQQPALDDIPLSDTSVPAHLVSIDTLVVPQRPILTI
jgi:hypothetical protein